MPKSDMADTETEETLRQKIADGSQDPEDYRNLTDLLSPSGDYDEVIALYQRALTLPLTAFKKAQLSMELGWVYYEIGRQSQVTELAQEALSLLSTEPRSAEVLYCQGASEALLALSVCSTDANAGAEAARLALDRLEQAIADEADFKDKSHAYIDAARMHSLLGNVDKVGAHCEACLAREISETQRISCLILYAQALQREERFAEAEQAITEAFRYGKNYKSGLLHSRLDVELGEIQRSTNRLVESKERFRHALAVLKSDPYFHNDTQTLGEVYFNLASVCYELGEYEDAVSSYNEVLRCDTKDGSSYWTALYWLGRAYEASEDHSKARDCYAEVSASSHATEDDKGLARKALMWVVAKLDYESSKYNEAAAAFEELVSDYTKADPDYWLAILWLGACCEGLGAYAKARNFYEDALNSPLISDANKGIARKGLARSLARHSYEAGEYKEAATKYEEILGHYPESDPNRWNTMIWLGSCYQGLGAYAKEQECYQRVLAARCAADADKVLARKKLTSSVGKAYYESKSYAEAIAAFEDVLTSCPETDTHRFHALVWLGYSYFATRLYARARDCFEAVLASSHASEAEKASAREGLARLLSA
ncbi:MAG TPA: tetratricopeptide repeat protein [Candidatus Binatia bacterium]|nr:tetratricopeptide repeat protein [Candidatus Binatia bacterium]